MIDSAEYTADTQEQCATEQWRSKASGHQVDILEATLAQSSQQVELHMKGFLGAI